MRPPRVTKRERKLYLSYELPHRVHCATVYPIAAPNGSTVIIYGHERGVRILWRGGRPRRSGATSKPASGTEGSAAAQDGTAFNSRSRDLQVSIDDGMQNQQQEAHDTIHDEYEDEEEELDADRPYSSITADVDVNLGTAVLHIAVPAIPAPIDQYPQFVQNTALVVTASADGAVCLLQIPLAPPVANIKAAYVRDIETTRVTLSEREPLPTAIDIKLFVNPTRRQSQPGAPGPALSHKILIAFAFHSLSLWTAPIESDGLSLEADGSSTSRFPLLQPTSHIHFHPSIADSQLLLVDRAGSVRIFDSIAQLGATDGVEGPSPSGSLAEGLNPAATTPGRWIMTFQAPFPSEPDTSLFLVRRKKILDSIWALNGKVILALLGDGEWGIWDFTSPSSSVPTSLSSGIGAPVNSNQDRQLGEFVIRGYLGSTSTTETTTAATTGPSFSGLSKQRKGLPKLAPMTPNTRKAKAETLFSGTPQIPGKASRGGLTVSSVLATSGQLNESITLWYNNDIFSIANMQAFWQRSVSRTHKNGTSSNGFGSLYAPGMTHVTDINLLNENISSISHFHSDPSPKAPTSAPGAALGQMNIAKDLLTATEYRLIISQNPQLSSSRHPSSARGLLFHEPTTLGDADLPDGTQLNKDQQMLDAGELDIGGMDRLLDGMASTAGGPAVGTRARKVGFAAFTE